VTCEDIDRMVAYYLEHKLDTLIPVREEKLHAFCADQPINFDAGQAVRSFCEERPVNFDPGTRLPMTQNIPPVKICAWTVCIWRPRVFIKAFESAGHAVFSGKVGLYAFDKMRAVKISTEEDFVLAELLLENERRWRIPRVPYDSELAGPGYPIMWLNEIGYIEKLLLEQAAHHRPLNVLEWGSGRSTVYFSKFLKKHKVDFKWSAVENYIPWHEIVKEMIREARLEGRTDYYLKSPTREDKKVQETLDMSEFLDFPATLGKRFDFILIDARKRKECLMRAKDLLAPGGVVVLHDAEREDHQETLKLYKGGGAFVCENKSPVPGGVQKLWVGRLD
jgi:predicted O-methyltransferase YrrM